MKPIEKIKELIQTVKIHLGNENLHDDVSYTAFWLGLLPIPGFQQCNQVIDRIASNKALKIRLDDIWSEINSTNDKISTIEDDIEKLQEIGGTVNYNNSLKEQVESIIDEIIGELKSDTETEWIMETENWSYQEVLNSFVEADFAAIIAKNNSTNVVENTEIKAKKTHLHAKDNSKNFIDKTRFSSSEGSVGMDGITTQGDITVQGSGIGLGAGSALIFGGNPNLVSGNCPFCNTKIQVDKRQLTGYTSVRCPNPTCGRTMNFTIN
ncbi:Rcat domain-containing protein [Maribacter cobaltidurans]|uniref:Uncharacterized protein n=1 Tax=Maribacter cobaltidurans TaxID=1178778 RepID=A0A223V341_9FLAO|nr:hypothetical protein [Maribacter cobaltidurans]ASV29732.1 hypothetical protein CJ263_05590 [Maribacter cobaltidurans]GGD97754.1 hypothetical protein GCM10011412_39790 [Maribacter cobaltidurans]